MKPTARLAGARRPASATATTLVIVGQAPGRTGDPRRPLEGGAVGRRLVRLLGMSELDYLLKTERHNVLNRWLGRSGKGDLFPKPEARKAAHKLAAKFRGRRVLLLGKNVAAAFGLNMEYLRWTKAEFEAAVLPHPSGVNRWWNNPRNRRAAERFARLAARGIL